MATEIRTVRPDEFPSLVPALVDLLIDTVDDGASLGFIAPVVPAAAWKYWIGLVPEFAAGSRVLVGVFCDGHIAGSAQLWLPSLPNARHRADVQKVFIARTLRGRGVGAALMAALHECARQRDRTLLLLNARRNVADRFYKPLGYREVGVIPGYSLGSNGARIDTASLYLQL